MRVERASRTAMLVAYMRALADAGASHVRDFKDPTARIFLSERRLQQLHKVERQLASGRDSFMLAFRRVAADMMALRTATIDAAVHTAVARGTRQLVILGAGLDGRCWRMPVLEDVRAFEVDHPATQALKRSRAAKLGTPFARVTFVPIDFERDALASVLAGAGHDDAQPTCWIWEGVVMYLTRDAMLATLASVASRSAPGSTLIVNYHTMMRRGLVGLILRAMGEPVRSKWSREEMAADLTAAGFHVTDDTGIAEWVARFATGTVNQRPGRIMRIAVAERNAR